MSLLNLRANKMPPKNAIFDNTTQKRRTLAFLNNFILKRMMSPHFKHSLFSFFSLDHFRLWVGHISSLGNCLENYLWPLSVVCHWLNFSYSLPRGRDNLSFAGLLPDSTNIWWPSGSTILSSRLATMPFLDLWYLFHWVLVMGFFPL